MISEPARGAHVGILYFYFYSTVSLDMWSSILVCSNKVFDGAVVGAAQAVAAAPVPRANAFATTFFYWLIAD